jgi:aminotransferase
MPTPFARLASRRAHLETGNLLRSLTDVINRVEGGINLGQGVCDMDTPAPLVRGAHDSISGKTDRQLYTPYAGLPELRELIAAKLRSFNGLDYGADDVVVAAGSSGAFFATGMTLLDPGDEVVLFEPFYPYHHASLRLMGAVPRCVRLGAGYRVDFGALAATLSPRTRAVVVNTPANPSGMVWNRAELERLGELLAPTAVVVVTDEVYEYMCFDGKRHVSPGVVPSLRDRTLTIGGYSKTYSITGWRIGYVAGPAHVVNAIGVVFDQMNVCAARPMQRGVERALRELPAAYYADLGASYQRKRDQFCAALAHAGFRFEPPEGAYYVLADYSGVFGEIESYPAVLRMIEAIRVNAVPGQVFYEDPRGVRSMRFQFAVMPRVLDEACARLRSLAGSRRTPVS